MGNIGGFKDSIPRLSLPRTFQDAVDTSLKLGFRYLWIDSLCIVQDSPEDWSYEAAQMEKVYRNSSLNLSAAGASNSTEGLYFVRDPKRVGPPPECPSFRNFDWRNDRTGDQDPTWHMIDEAFWERICLRSPLFSRAWVFQERLLAKRVLHFGKEQLFWECRTDDCCETFPDGLPNTVKDTTFLVSKFAYDQFHGRLFSKAALAGRLQKVRNHDMKAKIELFWQNMVTDYTECKLSHMGDKLIALAGLAKDFSGLIHAEVGPDSDYLAGTWSTHLPHALLWRCETIGSRPPYRAPSWSWAAPEGMITWDNNRWNQAFTYTARILHAEVEPVDHGNYFSQVKGGFIRIRGPVWKLIWSGNPHRWVVYATPIHEDSDGTSDAQVKESDLDMNAVMQWFPDERYDVHTEDWSELYGMRIVRYEDPSIETHCMLILIPDPDGKPNAYRRVGIGFSGPGLENSCWSDSKGVETEIFIL